MDDGVGGCIGFIIAILILRGLIAIGGWVFGAFGVGGLIIYLLML